MVRQELGASAAYLLRSDDKGQYVPWIQEGPRVESMSIGPSLVPMHVPVVVDGREHPATILPLESAAFGTLLLVLLHERRLPLRAQDLQRLAEQAAFLFTLVENRLLLRQSRSVATSFSYLSTIAASGELNEEDLAHLLQEILAEFLAADAVLHGRLRAGKAELVSATKNHPFPPVEDIWHELADRTTAVSGNQLFAAATFGDRVFFWAFATEVASVSDQAVARLIRSAEETYRRHRSDAGVRESIDRVSTLYTLEREFADDSNVARILQRTLEEVARASSAPILALIALRDGQFDFLAHLGLDYESASDLFRRPEMEDYVLSATQAHDVRSFFLQDLPLSVRQTCQRLNLQTLVFLPVRLGGEAVGITFLGFHEECVLEENLVEHLRAISSIGAQAFTRQQLSLERQEILANYRSLAVVTDVALSDLPLEELLTTLGERLYDVLSPESVVIFLAAGPEDPVLRPLAAQGILAHLTEGDLLLSVEEAEAFVSGPYAVFEPNDPSPPALRHVYGRVVATAIRSHRKLLGIVRLDFPLGRRLKEGELNLLRVAGERLSYVAEMRDLIQRYHDLYVSSILSLAGAVDAKDPYTRDHSEHVSRYARAIAEAMQLPPDQVEEISTAGLLHDVGKIAIPDAILNKAGRLTAEEYEIVKTHAEHGARIVEQGPALRHLGPMIRYHHERPDGKGYYRLGDASAPLGAYIIAVADAFDTMTTDRPYRPALTFEEARAELTRNRGTQFLPVVVDTFTMLLDTGRLPLRDSPSP